MMGMATRIPFNFILNNVFTAQTSVSTPFRPNIDNLIGNISQNFEFYRISQLSIKGLPAGILYDFTYYPSNEASSLADTFATVALSSLNRCLSMQQSVPQSLRVPKKLLYQSPEDWWSTNSSSALYQQGRFVCATTGNFTGTITFTVQGIIEFKAPSANTSDLAPRVPIHLGTLPASCVCTSCVKDKSPGAIHLASPLK
jgi:hypothetical protein